MHLGKFGSGQFRMDLIIQAALVHSPWLGAQVHLYQVHDNRPGSWVVLVSFAAV